MWGNSELEVKHCCLCGHFSSFDDQRSPNENPCDRGSFLKEVFAKIKEGDCVCNDAFFG